MINGVYEIPECYRMLVDNPPDEVIVTDGGLILTCMDVEQLIPELERLGIHVEVEDWMCG